MKKIINEDVNKIEVDYIHLRNKLQIDIQTKYRRIVVESKKVYNRKKMKENDRGLSY